MLHKLENEKDEKNNAKYSTNYHKNENCINTRPLFS